MGEKGQDAQKGPQEPGVDGGKVQLPGACTQCGLRCSGEMCAAPQRVGRRRTAALSATQLFHASPGLGPGAITPEAHRKRARRLQTLEHTPRSAGAGEDLAAESGSWGRRGAGRRGAGRTVGSRALLLTELFRTTCLSFQRKGKTEMRRADVERLRGEEGIRRMKVRNYGDDGGSTDRNPLRSQSCKPSQDATPGRGGTRAGRKTGKPHAERTREAPHRDTAAACEQRGPVAVERGGDGRRTAKTQKQPCLPAGQGAGGRDARLRGGNPHGAASVETVWQVLTKQDPVSPGTQQACPRVCHGSWAWRCTRTRTRTCTWR